jgi:NAD(P)-dependent dehydrogenase (short-subunit alcohol dehydrogenase family)
MSLVDCQAKRVIVTAGASGIGLAIARAFAAKGARVHVCDVAAAALAALPVSDPGIIGHRANVADEKDMDRFMADAIEALGGVDVLVNNAGMAGPTARIENIAFADWRQTLSVNLDSMFLATRRAVPALVAAGGGAIVNLSSVAGRLGVPLRLPYATSKFGVVGLTETLAMELGPRGISVNAILPGPVEGERLERVLAARAEELGSSVDDARTAFVRKISMRTTVTAEEIADMAVYLACGPGRHISGQSISVCGNVETLGED